MRRKGIDPDAPPDESAEASGRGSAGQRCVQILQIHAPLWYDAAACCLSIWAQMPAALLSVTVSHRTHLSMRLAYKGTIEAEPAAEASTAVVAA